MADSKTRKRRLRTRRQQAGLKAALVWLTPVGRPLHPDLAAAHPDSATGSWRDALPHRRHHNGNSVN
jgi:hypothetical protein